MRKMKETEVAWLNCIPENWEIKRLKNVLKERKENNNPIKTDNILSLTNDKGVIPYSEKGNQGNKAKDDLTGYKLAYPNDIVMNSMNVVIGSVGLSQYYGCVSPVYYMLYSDKYDIRYYNYIFQSKIFQNELRGLGNGILEIRMRIPMEKMNNVIMPIPPRNEQEKIANFLDNKICEIDNIIIKTKKTIEDYKKYKQSIITEVVTKGLEKNSEMKKTNIEWVDLIPKYWNDMRLKNKLYVRARLGWKGLKAEEYVENGYPLLSAFNIINSKLDFSKVNYINKFRYDESPEIKLAVGDILLVKDGAGIGKCAIVEKLPMESTVNGSIALLTCEKGLNSKYLYYYFLSEIFQKYIDRLKDGMGVPHLFQRDIKMIYLAIPPLNQQNEIVNYLNKKCIEIDNLILNKQKIIEELEQYEKSLIYEYVTGKKEVKENNLLKKNDAKEIKINCKDNIFAQAILLCRIIEKLNKHNLGRVKAEKALYLIERDIGFNFENNYVREKAGPLSEAIYKCESVISKKNRWVKINNKKNSIEYKILPNFSNYTKYYKKYYSDYDKKIERIIKIIKDYSMDKAEMVATLYASWNDFIIKKEKISDIKIVKDVRENWNDTKKRFKENEWLDVLKEMKQVGLIPKGKGNLTIIKEQ